MKKAIVILSVLMLFAASSFATQARVDSLGVSTWMVQDEYLTTTYFPQMVVNYDKMAKIEYGNTNFAGQANLSLGPGVLGIIANVPNVSVIAGNAVTSTGAIYGFELKGMALGVGLTYGSSGTKQNNGAINGDVAGDYTSVHAANIGIVAGLGINLGKNMPLDLGLRFNVPSKFTQDDITKNATGVKTAEAQDGTTGIELAVDGRIGLPGDMMGNVGVSFVNLKRSNIAKGYTGAGILNASTEDTTNGTIIAFSVGAEKTVQVGSAMVIFGIDPNFGSGSTSRTNVNKITVAKLANDGDTTGITMIGIPLSIGVENKMNETWMLRGGVSKNVWDLTSTVTKNKNLAGNVILNTTVDSTANATPVFTFGLGGKFGDVSIDGNLATAFLTNGPFILTGTQTGAFASEIAISYSWK